MERKLIKIIRASRTLIENSLKMFFPREKFKVLQNTQNISKVSNNTHIKNVNAKIKKKRPQNAALTGKRREKIDFW